MIDFRRTLRAAAAPTVLFALALLFTLSSIDARRLPELWRLHADIGTLAIAMTPIMILGGIDLSVGSIVALSGVALGVFYRDLHLPIALAAVAGVATGTFAGAINGSLISWGIAPLVATLATMALFRGAAFAWVDAQRIANLPSPMTELAWNSWAGLPTQVYLLLVVGCLYQVLVHHTRIGRMAFAIGENRLAADFAAVPVRRVEFLLYVLSGTVAGLVGVSQTAYGGAASPDAGQSFELLAIACVVLGGTRVTGGYGSILWTALGIATLSHLKIGFGLNRIRQFHIPGLARPVSLDADMQLILIGLLVILVAVLNERLAGRRRD